MALCSYGTATCLRSYGPVCPEPKPTSPTPLIKQFLFLSLITNARHDRAVGSAGLDASEEVVRDVGIHLTTHMPTHVTAHM